MGDEMKGDIDLRPIIDRVTTYHGVDHHFNAMSGSSDSIGGAIWWTIPTR